MRALAIQEVMLLLMLLLLPIMLLPLLLLPLLLKHQSLQLNLLQAVYGPSRPEVKFTLEGQMSKHNTKTLQSSHLYATPLCSDVACRADLSQAYSSIGDSAREQEYVCQRVLEARAHYCVVFVCDSTSIARVLNSCESAVDVCVRALCRCTARADAIAAD